MKRCASHLEATAYIWCKLIERLADAADIHTLGQLRHWLKKTKTPAGKKSYPMPREIRLTGPCSPGVYRMKRSNDDILYIGKARSLKQRMNSYFQTICHHSAKILGMLTQAKKIDYTKTQSALEAALLEADEIKQFNPPYNIALTNNYRGLVFVSRNFAVSASTSNERCRLVPVPLKIYIKLLTLLSRLLIFYRSRSSKRFEAFFGCAAHWATPIFGRLFKFGSF